MSPAPGTALAPASVSLLDLNAEALLVRGLSLVSQAPAEALAGASRAPCPGIGMLWGGSMKNVTGFRGVCQQGRLSHRHFPV